MPSVTNNNIMPTQIPSATTLAMTSPPAPHHASLSLDPSTTATEDSPAISVTTLPSPTSPVHLNHPSHPSPPQHRHHGFYQPPPRPLSYSAPTDSWDHPFFRPAVLHIDRPPRAAHHHHSAQSSPGSSLPHPAADAATSNNNNNSTAAAAPPVRPTVRIDQYTLGRTLGQGSMGKVKLATDPDGVRYAIKIIPRSGHLTNEDDAAAETRVVREASVLFLLNHPNIVKLVDALVTPQHFYLVMEFVDGPQLLDHVVARGRLSEEEARRVAVGLISAMAYCHHHHIVHRDLKIENILLTKTNQIKLLDFGLANFYDPHAHLHTFCGSLYFASPELISAQPYTGPEVDAWSLGVVLYVLVTARVPFDAPSLPELHAKIKRGNPTFPPHCSPQLVDLLARLLTVDPRARATVHEAARHPWLQGMVPLPVAQLVPPDRDTRAAALVRRFGRPSPASASSSSSALPAAAMDDLGPLHEDATILLAQLTHLPVRDLQRGIGTPNHHLHALHVLTYEWLHRAYASAATRGDLFLGSSSQASLVAAAAAGGGPAASTGKKRTSVALAHASAVAGRRASYLGAAAAAAPGGHASLARRAAGGAPAGHLATVDEAIVVSQAGSLQSRRASGSVMTMATSAAGTTMSTMGGAGTGAAGGPWVMTDAILSSSDGGAPLPPENATATGAGADAAPSTPSLAPASPRSAHVHMTSSGTHHRRHPHDAHHQGGAVVPVSLPPSTAPAPGSRRHSPPTGDVNGRTAAAPGGDVLLRATSTGSAGAAFAPAHPPRPRTVSGPTTAASAGTPIVFSAPPPPPVPLVPAPATMVLEQGRQREVSNESNASVDNGPKVAGSFKIEIQPLPANTAAAVQMEAAAARPAASVRVRGATAPVGKPAAAAGSPSSPGSSPRHSSVAAAGPLGGAVAWRAVGASRQGSAPEAMLMLDASPAESHASLSPSPALVPAPTSPARVVGRKPSMQSLFAGSHVISLPNGYAQPRAQGGLGLVDPIARIAQLARGMHLHVEDVDVKQCVVTHRPSVNVENRVTVAQVKLTRQGFGLLRPCLAFRQKSGDADAFRMVVQGLQREWMRVVVSGSGAEEGDQGREGGEQEGEGEGQVAAPASTVVAAA